MGALGLALSVAPRADLERRAFAGSACADSPETAWALSEVMRHSARDIAEAGRELGRFDSRPWLRPLPIPVGGGADHAGRGGAARQAAPARRRRSTRRCSRRRSATCEITTSGEAYNPVLLQALAAVGGRASVAAA